MGKGSGGGGVQQSESVVTQTNLPEYAKPFYEEMLGRTVYESTRPYETYQGQRISDFNPFETTAMTGMAEMAGAGTPQQIRSASDIATQIGFQPTNMGTNIAAGFNPQQQFSNYQAGTIASGYAAPTDTSLTQGFQAGTLAPTYTPGTIQSGYTPETRTSAFAPTTSTSGYAAGDIDPGYIARELGQDYAARDLQSQYTGQGDFGPGFQAGTVADAATLESYMNPYQQLVTDIEAREAKRASDTQAAEIGQQAAMAGGLGGYREGILQSERERNLSQQLADIQAKGGQAAFAQAQQAFEADRAARLQEAQLGLQTGTQAQQAQQQAEQLRQSAFGTSEQARQAQQKMAIDSFQAGEQARQQAAQLGMTAQQQEDASQQAQEKLRQGALGQTMEGMAQQEQFAQRAFDAGQQAKQQAAQLGLSAAQQQEAANQASQRFRSEAFAENQRGQLAQQQEARAVFQAREQAKQQAAQLGLSAAETQERMDQAQNQAAMAAREFNVRSAQDRAQLGLAGLQADQAGRGQSLDAARLLSSLGGQEQAMAFDRLRNLQAAGEIQRGLDQRSLDMGYQDFLRQQAFPREQIGFFSNMLQGLPVTPGSTMASYGVQPSTGQQLLGAGIGGVGLYNALGRG
jgi:hypothetical protein